MYGKKTDEKDDRHAEYRFDNTFNVYVPDYKLSQSLGLNFSCFTEADEDGYGETEADALYGELKVHTLNVFNKDPATALYEERVEVNMLCHDGDEEDSLGGKIGLGSKIILKLRWRPHFESK